MISSTRTVLAVIAVVALASSSWAASPTDELRSYVDRVVAVLENPEMKGAEHNADRHRAVRAIVDEGLDFREAARRTLGPYWDARTPAEQGRFIELFTTLIDNAYVAKVKVYDGEKVAYDSEQVAGTYARVSARVTDKEGEVTPVDFHLARGADGHWRVYDAVFEGVSLVGNYRSQFQRIMRTGSFQDLQKRIEAHLRTMHPKD